MTSKQPDYNNLKRYKKQKGISIKSILTVFVTTFVIMLVFFIGAAQQMTPSVDVAIGENSATETKETGLGVKGFIDNRLRAIQSEDTSLIAKKLEEKINSVTEAENQNNENNDDNYFTKELEEKVVIPAKKIRQELLKTEELDTQVTKPTEAPLPKPETVSNVTYKVLVGNYHSIEQAKVTQSILQESNLGVSPFVKNIHGIYTLQVGSFNSEEKAQELVNELQRNNYPARIMKN